MRKAWIGLLLTISCHGYLLASFPASSFELPNNLRIILLPDNQVEATSVGVYYRWGGKDDPVDSRGASYLYQFLMFGGTRDIEPYDHILLINRTGGTLSGRVNYDNSFFYQIIPATEMHVALWLESERITSLRLSDEAIEHQKNQAYERISRLQNSSVAFQANNWVKAQVFAETPYETPLYGDIDKLKSISNQRIRDLYANFQNIANIILVIAGRFDINDLKNGLNRFFQDLPPAASKTQVTRSLSDVRKGYIYKNWISKETENDMVVFGFRAPAKTLTDYLYLSFIQYYLCDPRISRLEYVFNQVNELNINISHFFSDYFDANIFSIQLTAASRINLEKARYLINSELNSLQNYLLDSSEIRSTKALLEIDFLKNMQALEIRSQKSAEYYHLTGEWNFFDRELAKIKKISSYDIIRIAKKYLNKENRIILNVYQEK